MIRPASDYYTSTGQLKPKVDPFTPYAKLSPQRKRERREAWAEARRLDAEIKAAPPLVPADPSDPWSEMVEAKP